MYLFISPQNSKNIHPNNSPSDFTIELPSVLKQATEIALTDVFIEADPKKQLFFLLCDVIDSSYLEGVEYPVLASFWDSAHISNPHYISLKQAEIRRIRFSLKTFDNSPIDNSLKLCFTLHVKEETWLFQ